MGEDVTRMGGVHLYLLTQVPNIGSQIVDIVSILGTPHFGEEILMEHHLIGVHRQFT